MKFNELSWAAFCFYYRSVGDQKYGKIMGDTSFISKLREAPSDISVSEFEQKVILDYVSIESYDLLIKHKLAEGIVAKIVDLQPEVSFLQNSTILNCNLSDEDIAERIKAIYSGFHEIHGLWVTGISKILHLLNNVLFPILNPDIADYFRLPEDKPVPVDWLTMIQQHAQEVTKDFHEHRFLGSPETFLSEKLGYTRSGYQKSLIKFIDEYYWLRIGDRLPIPPSWAPACTQESYLFTGKE